MAKIIVTLVMIFSLFWNHGNATTPRKLGIRQNAVTSLPYKVTSRGSSAQYSLASSPLVHANVETLHLLGNRYNGVTSLPSTKEATFDRPGRHYFIISSSSADHANVGTPRILRARHGGSDGQDTLIPSSLGPTQMDVAHYRFSSSQMWQPKKSKATPPKLWASGRNEVTSLSNTTKTIAYRGSGIQHSPISSLSNTTKTIAYRGGSGIQHSPISSLSDTNKAITYRGSAIQHSPISSSLAHTHATIRHILQTRYGVVTSLSNTNKAITSHASRHAATRRIQQTRVGGIQSLSDTNKAITSRGSGIFYYPISSSSSTYTHATIPHTLGARHNAVTSSPNADEGITRKHGAHQNPIIITSLPSTN